MRKPLTVEQWIEHMAEPPSIQVSKGAPMFVRLEIDLQRKLHDPRESRRYRCAKACPGLTHRRSTSISGDRACNACPARISLNEPVRQRCVDIAEVSLIEDIENFPSKSYVPVLTPGYVLK